MIAEMPLWHNPGLPELFSLPDIHVWENHGVTRLAHVYDDNVFLSFEQFRMRCEMPPSESDRHPRDEIGWCRTVAMAAEGLMKASRPSVIGDVCASKV